MTMDNEQIKENLRNMAAGAASPTPQAALDYINRLESALHKIAYWFETDQETLDSMTAAERNDHIRQHKMLLNILFQ